MTAIIIILSILLFFTLIALIRAAVRVEYSETGLLVQAKIAFITITLVPSKTKEGKRKKEKKPKKEKAEKKEEQPEEEKKKKGGSFETIKQLLPPAVEALKRFFKKLRIDDLTVHFTSGNEDPYNAAMMFGRASMAFGIVMPLLESAFKIKKRNLTSDVTFDGSGDKIYINAQLSLAVWELVYIACAVLPALMDILLAKKVKN